MSILFIDACVRDGSRTRALANEVLSRLDGGVTTVELRKTPAQGLDRASLERRTALAAEGRFDDPMSENARRFAAADEIVVAAPYWELSFPAALKAFFESVCVVGLTFAYDEQGIPCGLCRAKRLIYVTTAGGTNIPLDFGFGYVRALCERFFGIAEVALVKAEGLDIVGADADAILAEAAREAEALL